jgi:hypothetical protein
MHLACTIVLFSLLAVAPCAALCGDPSTGDVVEPSGGAWEACASRSRDKTLQLGLHMDLTWEDDGGQRRAAVARAREVHAAVSRNSFLWHLIEPTQGQYSWEITDAVVDELESNGIEPLFMMWGSPSWANGVPADVEEHFLYVPKTTDQFARWMEYYKAFAREAVHRYKDRVHKWELWGEQNGPDAWKPRRPNVDEYAAWFRAVQAEIKSVDPNAEVALGGLYALNVSGDGVTGADFLKRLYERDLYPDIINVHPYSEGSPRSMQKWSNNFRDIEAIRNLMIEHGQADKPIWVTEWGWSTRAVGDHRQAQWIEESLKSLYCDYPYVSVATYFLDKDSHPFYQGLFDDKGIAKPSAAVFADIAARIARSNSR